MLLGHPHVGWQPANHDGPTPRAQQTAGTSAAGRQPAAVNATRIGTIARRDDTDGMAEGNGRPERRGRRRQRVDSDDSTDRDEGRARRRRRQRRDSSSSSSSDAAEGRDAREEHRRVPTRTRAKPAPAALRLPPLRAQAARRLRRRKRFVIVDHTATQRQSWRDHRICYCSK